MKSSLTFLSSVGKLEGREQKYVAFPNVQDVPMELLKSTRRTAGENSG